MNDDGAGDELSQIPTFWPDVVLAQSGRMPEARQAQERLIGRYGRAIRRYLLGAVRDPDAAEELFQNLALRLVRGGFRRANPDKGRFRSYLKSALFHLVSDYWREQARRGVSIDDVRLDPADPHAPADPDADFLEFWRKELLAAAWRGLHQAERETRRPGYSLLKYRVEHDTDSAAMAEVFTGLLGRSVDTRWVRKHLHRARRLFSRLLLDEVSRTLACPSPEILEQELIDLGLCEYCRPALQRRRWA